MLRMMKRWGARYGSDPEAILLGTIIILSTLLIMTMGHILAPVLASIVIAYLLQWVTKILISWKIPKIAAVFIVYMAFLGLFLAGIFILWPIIGQQLALLYNELPRMSIRIHGFLQTLPQYFPQFLTNETVDGWLAGALMQLKLSGRIIIAASLAKLPGIITMVIYLVLIPMMVFFFLKDSQSIIEWVVHFLPRKREILKELWKNVDNQIGNYIRGKVAEAILIGVVTYVAFCFFNMGYALLLSVLVGMSVLIPYVGAILVTIPVVLVGLFQWGWGSEFVYMLIAYTIIQTFDGVVLVPLLFSKVVSLHPLAIIIAILIFGGWWGFWGAFFAIPLAILVKAVLEAWPVQED